jgi:hypothetical protein
MNEYEIKFAVFYNNGCSGENYAVWCDGEYPTLEQALAHQQRLARSCFERIDICFYKNNEYCFCIRNILTNC